MKRQWKSTLALICCFVLLATLLSACKTKKNEVTVTYNPNYAGATSTTEKVTKGTTVVPPILSRQGFNLEGWCRDADGVQPIAATGFKVSSDITFYAKWTALPKDDGDDNKGDDNKGNDNNGEEVKVADMSIHFMELGNNSNGDSIYIKAGDTDILIDAGSSTGSAATIEKYVDQYCTDGKLEYVIATHGDTDHIAAFVGTTKIPGIFDYYECETIIDFARSGKNTTTLNNYYAKRDAEVAAGAKHYTALDCVKEQNGAKKVYDIADGITMEILYQKYYESSTSNENDYSVCVLFTQGDNHYLFLGDLEEAGEKSLVENNNLPEVELYKAGHHGSKTSANELLLSIIKPKVVCISCVAGHTEYTQEFENTFPTQDFINRIAPYTDKVYVTTEGKLKYNESTDRWNSDGYLSMNGNIVFSCIDGVIEVHGTNNDILLKDTEWFAANRTCPQAWA